MSTWNSCGIARRTKGIGEVRIEQLVTELNDTGIITRKLRLSAIYDEDDDRRREITRQTPGTTVAGTVVRRDYQEVEEGG